MRRRRECLDRSFLREDTPAQEFVGARDPSPGNILSRHLLHVVVILRRREARWVGALVGTIPGTSGQLSKEPPLVIDC